MFLWIRRMLQFDHTEKRHVSFTSFESLLCPPLGRTGAEGVIIRWIYCPLLHLDRRTGKNQELVQCTRASRPIPEVLVPIFSVEPSETAPPAVRWAAWVTAEAAVPRSVLPFKSRQTSLGMRFILFLSSGSNAWQDWKRKRKG